MEELMFLTTCNRTELMFTSDATPTTAHITACIKLLNPHLTDLETELLSDGTEIYTGEEALDHVLRLVASLESMVIGEREIITQFRKAYEFCHRAGLTGDFLRMISRFAIETGKEIYTSTAIARNPVSVASLAYRQLRSLGAKNNSRIVFVGSGETNTTLAKYFQKHEFANFTVFNRTLANGDKLAATLNGKAFGLHELGQFDKGFDILVVCTASSSPIITREIYSKLVGNDTGKKIIIDLSMPSNVDPEVAANLQVNYIDINSLRQLAEANQKLRMEEIGTCEQIIRRKRMEFPLLHEERKIELAFGGIPKQVKAIRELAVNEVFSKDISTLGHEGREVLDRILTYMEKKYNAVAIKTAKEILLDGRDIARTSG
jgi:glutamyl-tRNA reductase